MVPISSSRTSNSVLICCSNKLFLLPLSPMQLISISVPISLYPWKHSSCFFFFLNHFNILISCLKRFFKMFFFFFLGHMLLHLTCMRAKSFQYAQFFVNLWTVARQAPLSMGFFRQECWGGLPFPSPGIFLTQGLNQGLLHCRWILYHLSHRGSPHLGKEHIKFPTFFKFPQAFQISPECWMG